MITAITWWIWSNAVTLEVEKIFINSVIIISMLMALSADACLVSIVYQIAF